MDPKDATNTDGDGGEKDAPPTILDKMALSDEEHAALPPDQQVDREALGAYRTGITATITETVTETLRAEAREQASRDKADRDAAGVVQSEIDWYEELNRRRASNDPVVAQEATTEFNEKQSRWNDAHAEKTKVSGAVAEKKFTENFYAQYLPGAEKEVDGYTAYLTEHAVDLQGNALLGALRYGDQKGYKRGLAEGADAKEREQNVNRGADGAPGGGDRVAASGGSEKRLDIDLTKRGAGREIFRAGVELGSRS